MSDESVTRDLFDRWELVWHEGQYDLVPSCVAPTYLRHDALGDRTVTPESYAAELAKMKADRPDVRVAVYDHLFAGNRAWFRFTFRWHDPKTGEAFTQAGMQSYRIENGKLAETWITLQPFGSAWPDPVAQERWTSPPPA
jgi:SnoaL-like polyketide cyclase